MLDYAYSYIYNNNDVLLWSRKGGALLWRWHFSLRKDRDKKFMDLEKEWQKEEKNYQLRSHSNVTFFSFCNILWGKRLLNRRTGKMEIKKNYDSLKKNSDFQIVYVKGKS